MGDGDYFAVLGLAPNRYAPAEIVRAFEARRQALLAGLHDARTHREARAALDELHLAYNVLRDPARQAEYLRASPDSVAPGKLLRRRIAASLEDGLLRYSRRQELLAEGRELGFTDFQTQLLIAQVQFGEGATVDLRPTRASQRRRVRATPARLAAVGLLALALFLLLLRLTS